MAARAVTALPSDTLRALYPRVLAKTLGLTRALPDAEDAVQDAIERALESWPASGMPDSPEAWLVTVAANAHRDRLRRKKREESHADAIAELARMSPWAQIAMAEREIAAGWKDELLRLLFACCHPALETGESAALALATVVGLSVDEIAAAFLVPPRTMEQRLTRARKRLRERGDCEGVAPRDARDRLPAVTRVLHLLFNEGYWSTSDAAPIRAELCRLAVGLARALYHLLPDEAEVAGLLSLLLLHDARRGARLAPTGEAVPLPEQDRRLWDRAAIDAAIAMLELALAQGTPGPLQLEAAISAVHCRAADAAATDWTEIATLYELLERERPTRAVRVNRAFALSRSAGAAEGLALLDADAPLETDDYSYASLVRADLLEALGRTDEARAAFQRALERARNREEANQITARLERARGDRKRSNDGIQ